MMDLEWERIIGAIIMVVTGTWLFALLYNKVAITAARNIAFLQELPVPIYFSINGIEFSDGLFYVFPWSIVEEENKRPWLDFYCDAAFKTRREALDFRKEYVEFERNMSQGVYSHTENQDRHNNVI